VLIVSQEKVRNGSFWRHARTKERWNEAPRFGIRASHTAKREAQSLPPRLCCCCCCYEKDKRASKSFVPLRPILSFWREGLLLRKGSRFGDRRSESSDPKHSRRTSSHVGKQYKGGTSLSDTYIRTAAKLCERKRDQRGRPAARDESSAAYVFFQATFFSVSKILRLSAEVLSSLDIRKQAFRLFPSRSNYWL